MYFHLPVLSNFSRLALLLVSFFPPVALLLVPFLSSAAADALDWRSFDLPPFLSLKWLLIGTRPFFPQKKLSNGAPLLRLGTSVVGLPAPLSASPQEALVLCLWLPIIPMNPTILGSVRVVGVAGDVTVQNGALSISPISHKP